MSRLLRTRSPRSVLLLLALLSLAVASCDEPPVAPPAAEPGPPTETVEGGRFSVHVCEPEQLIPSDTRGRCGTQPLSSLYRGLITYDPTDGSATFDDAVARSITTEDDRTFTVTLEDGWTFHNGDPVDAQAFVDSWNFAAYAPNGQQNADFMSNIEGYDEVHPPVPEGGTEAPEPTAETMSGLEVVDELTFSVTLSEPFPRWPLTVGYTAFFPVPDEAFDDPEAFQRAPIGNGPFRMDGEWEDDEIRQVRYDDYAGSQPARAEAVVYRIAADPDEAYEDLVAGDLDVTTQLPPERVDDARRELGDRFIERPSPLFEFLGIPMYDEQLGAPAGEDGRKRRQALSLAIDREAIAETVFEGSQRAAYGFVSPAVRGSREQACPEMRHDPERARRLWDEVGGHRGPVTIWFNADGEHEGWAEEVAEQWRATLGIEDVVFETLPFTNYLTLGRDRGFTGPFRLGWVYDYPSPQNYLEPLYATDARPPTGSNYAFYSNPSFDELIDRANQHASLEEAIPLYQQAEDLLCDDLPVLPQRWGLIQGGHSERVRDVVVDSSSHVRANLVAVVAAG